MVRPDMPENIAYRRGFPVPESRLLSWLLLALTGVVSAIAAAIVTAVRVRRRERTRLQYHLAATLEDLQSQLRDAKSERQDAVAALDEARAESKSLKKHLKKLRHTTDRFKEVKDLLGKSILVRTFHQPVLVVGPQYVGKTSLVKQWQAPWDHSVIQGTTTHRVCEVPILTFEEPDRVPHHAVPEVDVRVRTQLALRLHDFPGEVKAQQLISNLIREETARLRSKTKKDLGVVVICLFDAEEAHLGVRSSTSQYYNGELFRELRHLVAGDTVRLEKLILVFNKYDLLRAHYPREATDQELLELCRRSFADTCEPLRRVVNPERVCEVFTILGLGDLPGSGLGGNYVKGEAARAFVEAFRGKVSVDDLDSDWAEGAAAVALG
jgi:hypothetical protein